MFNILGAGGGQGQISDKKWVNAFLYIKRELRVMLCKVAISYF